MKLVLASTSRIRGDLLLKAGLAFDAVRPEGTKDFLQQLAQRFARGGFDQRIERAQQRHTGPDQVRQLAVHDTQLARTNAPPRPRLSRAGSAPAHRHREKLPLFEHAKDRRFGIGFERAGDFLAGLCKGDVLKLIHAWNNARVWMSG